MGNAGSGKSTLAARLSRESVLAHLDLDTLAWEPVDPPQRRALQASLDDMTRFMDTHERWVLEGCYADLLDFAIARCTRLLFLNPGIDACIDNCRVRPWEPHKYPSVEAQNRNLEMLLKWVHLYDTRQDAFSLHVHRKLFERFQGDKIELTSNLTASQYKLEV
jgi:adenylate kinase family enzyme